MISLYLATCSTIAAESRRRLRPFRVDFDQDDNLQLALTHLIQIVGEAAARVSEETCLLHPEVDWPNIVSLRNRIVHDYSGLAMGRIWDVATINVPELITALEAFMPSDPP